LESSGREKISFDAGGNFVRPAANKQIAMSNDDRFRGVDWEAVLYRVTLRARQLFAAARAKGYGNALARTSTDPDDLALSVIVSVLENQSVKFKPSKGANLTTFLCHVLEDDFKDLIRKGMRLDVRLRTLDPSSEWDEESGAEPGVIRDIGDESAEANIVELRAAALHAVNGNKPLEDYLIAVFDCGASKRADQAELLGVPASEITNRRKQMLRLFRPDVEDADTALGCEE
jgi:DNA-directed RNA polymerase specialized sigma24 family protein